jgi:uncharacterized protein YjbJ (UPF0337 family)
MDTQTIEKNWFEVKGRMKARWTKFSDEELESVRGDINQLSGKIQKVYGVAKEQAEHQYEDFKKSVSTLISREFAVKPETKVPTDPNVEAYSLKSTINPTSVNSVL